MTKISFQE